VLPSTTTLHLDEKLKKKTKAFTPMSAILKATTEVCARQLKNVQLLGKEDIAFGMHMSQ
jgi:hypothetical protein